MKNKTTIKRRQTKSRIINLQRDKNIHRKLPLYCDFYCKYATFTDKCLSGACNRESAIYCKLFERYNNKHARCFGEK